MNFVIVSTAVRAVHFGRDSLRETLISLFVLEAIS